MTASGKGWTRTRTSQLGVACILAIALVAVGKSQASGADSTTGSGPNKGGSGTIAGRVVDTTNGVGVDGANVSVYDAAGRFLASGRTDSQGFYTLASIAAGTTFVTASDGLHQRELYEEIPCPFGCDLTSGTPVLVQPGVPTDGIDFTLEPFGSISGRLVDAAEGFGLGNALVLVYDTAGDIKGGDVANSQGFYTAERIAAGTYFVEAADNFYQGEIYDDIPCLASCEPTAGTAVPVQPGVETEDIDFALEPLGSIRGRVVEAGSGLPLARRLVQVWSANGLAGTGSTDVQGFYRVNWLFPRDHFVTVSSAGHADELYDDLPCPGGPGVGCDPLSGTPIPIVFGAHVTGVDFELQRLVIFSDGFESGDTGSWSTVVPNSD